MLDSFCEIDKTWILGFWESLIWILHRIIETTTTAKVMSFFHSPNIFISSYQLIIEMSDVSDVNTINIHLIHRFWIKLVIWTQKKNDFLIWIGHIFFWIIQKTLEILKRNCDYIIGVMLSENVSMILFFWIHSSMILYFTMM